MRTIVLSILVTLAGAGVGCGCGADRGRGLLDPDAAYKVPAIKAAVARDDESAIPQLVKDLSDDDSAVRFYAIEALKRLTNQTLGYLYYQEVDARAPAVQRWQAWLEGRESK